MITGSTPTFIFGGTNSLNLGTGNVPFNLSSSAPTGTIILNGTNTTLTLGNVIVGAANSSGLTLTVNEAGSGGLLKHRFPEPKFLHHQYERHDP